MTREALRMILGSCRAVRVCARAAGIALSALSVVVCVPLPCSATEPAALEPAEVRMPELVEADMLGLAEADTVELVDILSRYNAVIVRERTVVGSLWVRQTMVEPQRDGSTKTSEAVLEYSGRAGMERRVISSDISNPAGEYTLDSLVGPELREDEYALEYVGRDMIEGEQTHHVKVTALSRDSRHFDGDIWISSADFSPVRIAGRVADPPFPVVLITLDKSFAPGPEGLRLLHRHSGEVEVNLLLGAKRGLRHIFYDDYVVRVLEMN